MDSHRLVAQLKIESAQNRAQALIEEVGRIKNRPYSSPASKDILEFVQEAATAIRSLLESEKTVADASPLMPAELEVRLHRTIKVIPYLHTLIGFIEGSEIPKSPGQLIQPLRRYVRSVIMNSDIVVSSKPELNYSIREVVASIRKAFSETPPPLSQSCAKLPDFLFLVNIPAIESEQILIHAILSHELGHALYNKHDLEKRLLPAIKIRDKMIRHLVNVITTGETESSPMSEIWLRQYVTDQVTERVSRWVTELSSDMIGIQLFGPALYFASTTLLSSFSHIDRCSSSHPPPRLRIKLMTRMLKKAYTTDKWHSNLTELIKAWADISGETIATRQPMDQIAIESLDRDDVLDLIETSVSDAIPEELRYNSTKLDADVRDLVPLILNSVPPGELGPMGREKPIELVSIINAGWYVYLCQLAEFGARLHESAANSRLAAATGLHRLILKALEISDIRISWEEAKRDSERGKD
ncbi:MAG TPA: hypothetical protein VKY85_04600 [Candidatus Angelobacter sp.]|nr:hypothetical protein [Candidatus Angelobacter sp.]